MITRRHTYTLHLLSADELMKPAWPESTKTCCTPSLSVRGLKCSSNMKGCEMIALHTKLPVHTVWQFVMWCTTASHSVLLIVTVTSDNEHVPSTHPTRHKVPIHVSCTDTTPAALPPSVPASNLDAGALKADKAASAWAAPHLIVMLALLSPRLSGALPACFI